MHYTYFRPASKQVNSIPKKHDASGRHLGPLSHAVRTFPHMILESLRIPGQLVRQEKDWKALVGRIPKLGNCGDEVSSIENMLRPAYLDYVRNFSSPLIALSLNRAAFCYYLASVIDARAILDLGSGLSTYVFKKYVQEISGQVISVDDSSEWLETTGKFLSQYKLDGQGLVTLKEFSKNIVFAWDNIEFDLCLVDIGDFRLRQYMLPGILSAAMRNGAPVIIDDFHVASYRRFIEGLCADRGIQLFSARKYTRRRLSHFAVILPGRQLQGVIKKHPDSML